MSAIPSVAEMTDAERAYWWHIDELVSEKVMGLDPAAPCTGDMQQIEGCSGWECEPEVRCEECGFQCEQWEADKSHKRQIGAYSFCIADAWRVVERMKTALPRWSAFRIVQGDKLFHAEWNVWTDNGPRNTGSVSHESAPRAICLAALRAMNAETET